MADAAYLDFYRRHLVDDVVAWWERAADDEAGGVLSCWSNDGEPLVSTDKYTWSQGRWVWLMARYARAALAGFSRSTPAPACAVSCRRRPICAIMRCCPTAAWPT